jgi:RNA polymerase sigma-B factor
MSTKTTTRVETIEHGAPESAFGVGPPCASALGTRGLSEAQLFARWTEHGDQRAREEILERFMPLAKKLARRYARGSEAVEDVTQVANMGLVKAVDRFDPSRGKTFAAFAIPTVLGEIRRHLRDFTWSVHVVRGAQERSMDLRKAVDALESENGRPPTVHDLAQYLEIDHSEVLEGLEVLEARRATSLDAPAEDDPANASLLDQMGAFDANYELVDQRLSALPALAGLTEREREILVMAYLGELTQVEIGARLGVSQMQVSRLMRRALERAQGIAAAGPAE